MTITFDIPPEDEPRVVEAFTSILQPKDEAGQPRTAEAVDITGALVTWMNGQTSDYEKRKNMETFSPPPMTLNPPQWAGEPIPE